MDEMSDRRGGSINLEALRCPGCGGSNLKRVAGREFVCGHCRTRAVLSPNRDVLILAGDECPRCGHLNQTGSRFCGDCGAKLAKPCPVCDSDVPLELNFCSACGHDFRGPSRILHLIETNGGPEGLDLSGMDLSGINLSRETVELELERARTSDPQCSPRWWARFGGINLAAANLSEANLVGANLSRAFLRDASLAGADLKVAVLTEAFLQRADLRQANLWEADLQDAYLAAADLRGANLVLANLENANLTQVDLRHAKLGGVRRLSVAKTLAGATLPDGTQLSKGWWKRELERW